MQPSKLDISRLALGRMPRTRLILYEHNNPPSTFGFGWAIRGTYWKAQSFTPSETHIISLVRLVFQASDGDAGTCYASIRATDGLGFPVGPDLGDVASFEDSDLPPFLPWTDTFIDLEIGNVELVAGIKYAIVVRAPSGTNVPLIAIGWHSHFGSEAIYTEGIGIFSSDAGMTWTADRPIDFIFQELSRVPTRVPRGRLGTTRLTAARMDTKRVAPSRMERAKLPIGQLTP